MNLIDLKIGPAAVVASPIFSGVPTIFGNNYPGAMSQPSNAGNILAPFGAFFHSLANIFDGRPDPSYAAMLAEMQRMHSQQTNNQPRASTTNNNRRVSARRV